MNTTPKPTSNADNIRTVTPREEGSNTESVFLDPGRAEVMFNMIVAPNLTNERLSKLIGAAFGASDGNPEILRLAIEAFSGWYPPNSEVLAQIERLWSSFQDCPPDFDFVATLRQICSEQSPSLPATMMEAIFDDRSFDFVAYLKGADDLAPQQVDQTK